MKYFTPTSANLRFSAPMRRVGVHVYIYDSNFHFDIKQHFHLLIQFLLFCFHFPSRTRQVVQGDPRRTLYFSFYFSSVMIVTLLNKTSFDSLTFPILLKLHSH